MAGVLTGFALGVAFMLAVNWFAPWWYRARIEELTKWREG